MLTARTLLLKAAPLAFAFTSLTSVLAHAQSQPPERGPEMGHCLVATGTHNNTTTIQNNCNKRLNFYVLYAGNNNQGGDIEPGADHAKDVWGIGPYHMAACVHGYEARQIDGIHSLHFDTTSYVCVYTGQF
jgi:hypothetical protein